MWVMIYHTLSLYANKLPSHFSCHDTMKTTVKYHLIEYFNTYNDLLNPFYRITVPTLLFILANQWAVTDMSSLSIIM